MKKQSAPVKVKAIIRIIKNRAGKSGTIMEHRNITNLSQPDNQQWPVQHNHNRHTANLEKELNALTFNIAQ